MTYGVLGFVIAILILVTIHEFGHYWVARRCGVEIEKFSIGFGKPLLSWTNKEGTVFSLSMIPLGGYVKMKGEYAIATAENQHQLGEGSFASKTVWQRMAIVLAGPLVNLLFALLILIFLNYGQRTVSTTQVQAPASSSLVASLGLKTGDTLTQINGHSTRYWSEVMRASSEAVLDHEPIVLQWRTSEGQLKSGQISTESLSIEQPDWIMKLGLTYQTVPWYVYKLPDTTMPAYQSGLREGDLVLSVNGDDAISRERFSHWVEQSDGKPLLIKISRQNQISEVSVTPKVMSKTIIENGKTVERQLPMVGLLLADQAVQTVHIGVWQALVDGVSNTYYSIKITLKGLIKIATGQLSLKNIGGPVKIGEVMGSSLKEGFEAFLSSLAMLSVSLGVLNLLPIPVLDGGHIMYYIIEAVRGRPVSQKTLAVGQSIGLVLVVMFMGLAFYNDLMHIFS